MCVNYLYIHDQSYEYMKFHSISKYCLKYGNTELYRMNNIIIIICQLNEKIASYNNY